jgi:predicted TIM-barrel fold metal-dependent hydrolase
VVSRGTAFGDPDRESPVIDRSIPVIDAHHHVTEPSHNPYAWLTEDGAIYTDYLGDYKLARADWPMERLLREFHGANVIGSIHIEAAWSGDDPVDETRYLAGVTARTGWPHGYVVLCDMTRDVRPQLEAHLAASPLVRGVRIREHPEGGGGDRFLDNLRACAERGLSFEIRSWPGTFDRALASARAVPELSFVVGNNGMPMSDSADELALWQRELALLAALPNVHCKVGGLGMVQHARTVDSIRPWVLGLLELFGVERCMFGSNWPVDAVYASYLMTVDAIRLILADAGLDADETRRVLCDNAQRFYRL